MLVIKVGGSLLSGRLALDFELEQLFFERLEQKRGTVLGRKNGLRFCTVRAYRGRRADDGSSFGRSCA